MLIDSHVNLHAAQFAEDQTAVIDRARAAGFACYWTKPLVVDDVLAGLDRLLGPSPA